MYAHLDEKTSSTVLSDMSDIWGGTEASASSSPIISDKSHTLENNKSGKQNMFLKDFDIPKGWLM